MWLASRPDFIAANVKLPCEQQQAALETIDLGNRMRFALGMLAADLDLLRKQKRQ